MVKIINLGKLSDKYDTIPLYVSQKELDKVNKEYGTNFKQVLTFEEWRDDMQKGMKASEMIGRKKSDDVYDFYESPKWATELILKRLILDGIIKDEMTVLEPFSGAGAISEVIKRFGGNLNLWSSDIQTGDHVHGYQGVNVFDIDGKFDVIISNPPYNVFTKNTEMLEKLLSIADTVILLLQTNYSHGGKRKEYMEKYLTHKYEHCSRLTMFPYGGEMPKNDGSKDYAWYVFSNNKNGDCVTRWIKDDDFDLENKKPSKEDKIKYNQERFKDWDGWK